MATTSRNLLAVAITLASFALASFAFASVALASFARAGALAPAQPLSKTGPGHPLGKSASPPPLNKTAPISVDASSSVVDYGTHHLILRNVVISQNDLRVTAERADATGLDFQDSRWIFTGDVHLSSEFRGKLDSDQAVVQFHDNQIQSAVATGHPAQFEQTDSSTGVLARGHADDIQYAVAAGTIRLTTDAWLKYGDNDEITAPVLVYNIKAQRLEGGPGSGRPGQRVHMIIVPKKAAPGPKAQARPPPKKAPKSKSASQSSSAARASSSSTQGPTP
jgi:lipopolysaccharide transport protein LptA